MRLSITFLILLLLSCSDKSRALTMSLSSALSTPTVVNQKGDRTTGSPLLDSFVVTPQQSNTAYLSADLAKTLTTNVDGLQLDGLQLDGLQRDRPNTHFLSNVTLGIPALVVSQAGNLAALRSQLTEAVPTQAAAQKTESKTAEAVEIGDRRSQRASASHNELVEVVDSSAIDAARARQVLAAKQLAISAAQPSAPQVSALKPPRRRPNPTLERAAAAGMLDLSDKLLFGREDDELISTYLGGTDPLLTEADETIVFKYLSKQIAESMLSKLKSRLPLDPPPPPPKIELSKVVLDAKNFKVVQGGPAVVSRASANSVRSDRADALQRSFDNSDAIASQSNPSELDVAAMNRQIDWLSQRVERLTRELADLTTLGSSASRLDSDEVA